jgi:hypothetical protein
MFCGLEAERPLYASGRPSQAKFRSLAAAGFRRVVNLSPLAIRRSADLTGVETAVRTASANRPAASP